VVIERIPAPDSSSLEHTARPSTFESYERNVRNHVIAHIGSTRLTKVDAVVLNGLYAHPLSAGRRPSSRAGKGYEPEVVERAVTLRAEGLTLVATAEQLRTEFASAQHITKDTPASLLRRNATRRAERPAGLDRRTVNYVHTVVHRALKDAVRWGRLARNPADAADPPRGGQKSGGIHAWDAATLRAFLDESRAGGGRVHGLWVLLATTGMRRGEALGLRWRDVDLDAGRAKVMQTITQIRGDATGRRTEDRTWSPFDLARQGNRRRTAR
jgi:integrase